MKTYILYWLHRKPELIFGNNIEDAFRRAYYTCGAVKALAGWERVW